jgi:hypothetical protein
VSSNPTPTPGLHRVVPKRRNLGLATKITGRNLASVSYIVSLEAERRGVRLVVSAGFNEDGSLSGIAVAEHIVGTLFKSPVLLPAGDFLVLPHDEDEAIVMTEADYHEHFLRHDN